MLYFIDKLNRFYIQENNKFVSRIKLFEMLFQCKIVTSSLFSVHILQVSKSTKVLIDLGANKRSKMLFPIFHIPSKFTFCGFSLNVYVCFSLFVQCLENKKKFDRNFLSTGMIDGSSDNSQQTLWDASRVK